MVAVKINLSKNPSVVGRPAVTLPSTLIISALPVQVLRRLARPSYVYRAFRYTLVYHEYRAIQYCGRACSAIEANLVNNVHHIKPYRALECDSSSNSLSPGVVSARGYSTENYDWPSSQTMS
ncbi:unnamed protein product [Peniophora sp. CBMAI 1063]|nr:unnamed protein product [Peniophora sp. CBMAI 1063]